MDMFMEHKKLKLGLGIGIAALVAIILIICVAGHKGGGTPAADNLEETPVTITEVGAEGLTGSYTDASGKLHTITVITDVTTIVEDVNGQEIGIDDLMLENTIRVKVNADGKAENILLLPDDSNDFC